MSHDLSFVSSITLCTMFSIYCYCNEFYTDRCDVGKTRMRTFQRYAFSFFVLALVTPLLGADGQPVTPPVTAQPAQPTPIDLTSIYWWITQLGPSGMFLFLFWRFLVWMKPLIESLIPHVRDVLSGHVKLMATLEEHVKDGSDVIEKVSRTQDEHGRKLNDIFDKIKPCS